MVFNQSLCTYLATLGYYIKERKQIREIHGIADQSLIDAYYYGNYNMELLKSIEKSSMSVDKDPNYVQASYLIKYKFDIYDLVLS